MNAAQSPLSIDREAHIYRLSGSIVPSVTDVLRPLDSFARIPFDALENARERGVYVHEAIALLVRSDLDWGSVEPGLLSYLKGGERFLLETGLTVVGSELPVYSTRLLCAGTIDLAAIWRRRDSIFDFKVTASVPATVGPQTAGYELLYREVFGGKRRLQRYCVHLLPDDYRVIPLDDTRDESIFLSALNLYHWSRRHAVAA